MWLKLYRHFVEKRYAVVICYILSFWVIVSIFISSPEKDIPWAKNGMLSLEGRNGEVFSLNGIWEFYPEQLLTAQDFRDGKEGKVYYISVPSNWDGYKYDDRKMYFGAATYRLHIILPEGFIGRNVAVMVSNIKASYMVFADDRLIAHAGKPTLTEQGWEMGHYPQTGFFEAENKELDIIVQVANYSQANSSGIVLPLRLGDVTAISRINEVRLFNSNASIAILVFSFLVCLGLYLQYKKQKELFYLTLFCFLASAFLFFQRTNLVFGLFPSFPKELWFRLVHITATLSLVAILHYTWHAFGRSCWRRLFFFLNILLLLIVISCIVFSVPILTHYEYLILLSDSLGYFYIVATVFKRGSLEGNESRFLAFGLLWYPISSLVIVSVNYVPTNYYVPTAIPLLILLVTQLLFISARYKTRQINERLVAQKTEMNYLLLRSQINPHFIHNVLNTISALTLVSAETARDVAEKFSQYLRISDRFTNTKMLISLAEELNNIECYIYIEKVRFGERLQFIKKVPAELEKLQVPPLSLLTIVENAVLHGISKKISSGCVTLEALSEKNYIIIKISNDGAEIDDDASFDSLANKRADSMGLKNTKIRLAEMLAATIEVRKTEEGITEFFIKIPRGAGREKC